ncbi:hypothetical protein [Blastococcus saxobsidens]|uniref:hypothetical protein n=1 Tax=Blastococcus saxobsidens TaxID=138336 RepID=UPI001E46F431|nr:hypothetical protein [Blastococcus saxobsidens]
MLSEEKPGSADAARQRDAVSPDTSSRDALAATSMQTADPDDALPGPVSLQAAGVIELPRTTADGPADVPTGFPRTPEGALAQLAAIDVTAMQTGSMDGVRRVIAEWAAPGGPTPETWSGVAGMASLLSAAGLSGAGSPQLAIVVRPAMGLIKGTVGPQFAVVCVNLEFTVTLEQTSRIAIADCQRMAWVGDRWVIGAGPEPAPAPSVWPGTDTAIAAGWRDLRHV